MMQLTINIPKELYEDIQRRSTAIQADGDTLENAVLNGIPLPQNHGDLIDTNGLKASMFCYMRDMNKSYEARYVMSVAKGLVDFQKILVKANEGDNDD